MSWLFLLLAIAFEVLGTTSLKASDSFSKLLPTFGVVLGYSFAFMFLSIAVKSIPLGTAYAVWSGIGTAGALLVGIFIFDEQTNPAQLAGIALILIGTVVLKFAHQNQH